MDIQEYNKIANVINDVVSINKRLYNSVMKRYPFMRKYERTKEFSVIRGSIEVLCDGFSNDNNFNKQQFYSAVFKGLK